jgi:hypothetical protein
MASQQIRVIVVRDVKELKNAQPAPDDMVCVIVPDVRFVYKPLDRVNARMIVIGNETFSETVSIKLYQKYISKYNLKHMTLILDTELKENDIHAMCKRVNPDDVIRLD